MTADAWYLTQEKYNELAAELENLKKNKIPKMAERIDDARQQGDLSENAEYHEAREQMGWLQGRLQELRAILDRAEMIEEGSQKKSVVDLGTTVIVDISGKQKEYAIVGAQEANPMIGKISNESPLGQALLGKRVGDEVEVQVPAGRQIYRIVSIQ